jgi:hypothetical protein
MKLVVNCETNEVIERELNKAEKDQQKLDAIEAAKFKVLLDEQQAAKKAILDRIGLTADELKTILG